MSAGDVVMDILPLAIIQARMGSTRLPGKMLLPVNGEPLVVRVWRLTCRAVGPHNVIVAVGTDEALQELDRVPSRSRSTCVRGSVIRTP